MTNTQLVPKKRPDLQVRFGKTVKHCRSALGISQEELAWRAGLHRTYVTDIERGARNISLRSVASLAAALKVPMSRLLGANRGANGGRGSAEAKAGLGEILLIEDNAADAELALRAFRHARISNPVQVLSDGAEALNYLFGRRNHAGLGRAALPQVILLDLNLPTIPGVEVLRELRQHARTRSIPVVVLTVSHQDADIAACRRLGAAAYLVKPVDLEKFIEATSQFRFNWALLQPSAAGRRERAASSRPRPRNGVG